MTQSNALQHLATTPYRRFQQPRPETDRRDLLIASKQTLSGLSPASMPTGGSTPPPPTIGEGRRGDGHGRRFPGQTRTGKPFVGAAGDSPGASVCATIEVPVLRHGLFRRRRETRLDRSSIWPRRCRPIPRRRGDRLRRRSQAGTARSWTARCRVTSGRTSPSPARDSPTWSCGPRGRTTRGERNDLAPGHVYLRILLTPSTATVAQPPRLPAGSPDRRRLRDSIVATPADVRTS